MASNNRKTKRARFISIPYHVVTSEACAKLRAPEIKLLVDLLIQRNGSNNGMLSPCYSLMKKRGWAKSSLYRAYRSLVHNGFLVITRQGYKIRGKATLVAVTWDGIDEEKNCTYDDGIKPSPVPLGYWCKDKTQWKHIPTLKPP